MRHTLPWFPLFILLGHLIFVRELSQVISAPLLFLAVFFAVSLSDLRIKNNHLIGFSVMVAITAAVGWGSIFSSSTFLANEFFTSFIQFVLLLLGVLFAFGVRMPSAGLMERCLRGMRTVGALHSLLLISQFFEWNILGSFRTLNPLGPLSKFGPFGTFYAPTIWDEVARPNGLFSEPSAAAWFTGACLASTLVLGSVFHKRVSRSVMVMALGMLATASLSGVINLLVIAGIAVLLRSRVRLNFSLVALALLALLTLAVITLLVTGRFEELSRPGTSLYVRLVGPTFLIWDVLTTFPLGLPLGQTDFIDQQTYIVRNAALAQTNLDNGIFVIIVYFGFTGLAAIAMIMRAVFKLTVSKNPAVLPIIALLLAISQSGALWAPNYIVLTIFTIIVARYCVSFDSEHLTAFSIAMKKNVGV